jgi:hypothetical protein
MAATAVAVFRATADDTTAAADGVRVDGIAKGGGRWNTRPAGAVDATPGRHTPPPECADADDATADTALGPSIETVVGVASPVLDILCCCAVDDASGCDVRVNTATADAAVATGIAAATGIPPRPKSRGAPDAAAACVIGAGCATPKTFEEGTAA